ncbi:nucleoside triphosphate pyrophosphohydrolase [Motiliproteus sp. MSK22-1]|uniref:nucleoside triphosphate pyrophosphohydrolase n=1 Tax=Motiliproteus sp. MSK22-1 TaxID=1897630 RepID=UPI0009779BED|nr:nucleoside triphosphate pyrophosphohydrolase [Motiliproteus sp. MSK22-1]OMH38130.1 nucleoside triphosphate pyrophosphohydrolase [Motiliproteus sp. MSK22-1]
MSPRSEACIKQSTSAKQYDLSDLLHLMRCLRDIQHGCPWDQKQTLASIVPHTLDEVYEVIDTIERLDYEHLQDELGDLLFQVVFYSQICSEESRFEFSDIIQGLVEKLLRRHPHVFPSGDLDSFGRGSNLSETEIKKNWEHIKSLERSEKKIDSQGQEKSSQSSALDDISFGLPALMRAHKIQKRAASVGFDWHALAPVLDNIDGELQELREAINSGSDIEIKDELGDLLFSCVNLARHLKQDSEQVLRQANSKFERRFRRVEVLATDTGIDMELASEADLDRLWQRAKQDLKSTK